MYKPLADSTLQRMKKTEIIELLRIAEHNAKVAQEYVDQQAKNLKDWAPVVHGRWIKNNNSLQTDDYYCCYFDYHCSECGKVVNNRYELPKYCPNCGAKMDGGADNG